MGVSGRVIGKGEMNLKYLEQKTSNPGVRPVSCPFQPVYSVSTHSDQLLPDEFNPAMLKKMHLSNGN
jgi:hypothetical protein